MSDSAQRRPIHQRETSNMLESTELVYLEEYKHAKVLHHNRYELSNRARFACALLEKHATIAGVEDGEDSSGRQKLKLQAPKELVQHCIEVSDEAFKAFEELGWYHEIPPYEEVIDYARESRGDN